MKVFQKYRKSIAAFLILLFGTQTLMPNTMYALTSGPEQPEMKGFEPIGNSDMVDLFSGDFSYNVPLMDVGGYPVNLSYHSGSNMDDEASWVGYGWGLNVGSLNRNLRGIPDDFNGTDMIERTMTMKDHITYGGRFSMALDLLGIPVSKINEKLKKKKKKLSLSLTLSMGIKYDNYRGIGADVGANAGATLSEFEAGTNTFELDDKKVTIPDTNQVSQMSGSFGLNLSSQDGASLSLNSSFLKNKIVNEDKIQGVSSSIGFGYNTRGGMAGMTLGSSFNMQERDKKERMRTTFSSNFASSFISFNGNTYTPTIDHPSKSNAYSFTLHLGPELQIALAGLGVTGFYSKQSVAQKTRFMPAYGFLRLERGKNVDHLLDFNREKDLPYSSQIKYLPITIPTYDLFTATSQDGGGQYRVFRGSSGVFGDHRTETENDNLTLGIEVGAGTYFDVGADLYKQDIKTITKKWRDRNNYLEKGDFQDNSADVPLYETAYFKRVGEPVPLDKSYVGKIKNTSPVAVSLSKNVFDAVKGAEASDRLRTKSYSAETTTTLKRDQREVRNTTFSYLKAREASRHALDTMIKKYHPDSLVVSGCTNSGVTTINRVGSYRKVDHLSEVTITGDDGKRNVYGIPTYNTSQEEVTFSIAQNLSMRNKGLIKYNNQDDGLLNKNGREHYYSKEKTPPYATSFLLTAILSPDYVDRTGNGVSDDDLGTAVKFNYSQLTSSYKWRTPFAFGEDTANYNEGFLSDELDDKANYVYGEKEIWYLHSIESKTMIAHFITENRLDGFGVINKNGKADTTLKLKRLKEIRLYSKSDLQQNGNNVSLTVPIKVVHFEYDYSICQGLPNSIANTGKLTLKRIFFTFGKNQKGRLNPYDFQYNTGYNFYNYRQYDRWNNFKDAGENPGGLNNSEFPYTIQDKVITDSFARAWQLTKIILPSGGSININYESDDYAFVQDRRASQMCMLNGVKNQDSSAGLMTADYIYVNLPYPVNTRKEMLERYFEGITNLYYKFFLDLDGKDHHEFVPGYAEIDGAPELVGTTVAKIKLKKIKKINPITKSGWQFIRTNLPKYAYPGSDNLADNGSNLRKAIEALVTAFTNVKELLGGFERRAKHKGYSDEVVLAKSWVRLCSPQWKKLGGGSRVKRVDISDDWATMSGATGAKTSTYGQVYDYTTKDARDRTISSGVASYEPMIGNDENPFREPIRYTQRDFLALNNYYYIEEPLGESFFPAASVGYSKVTVRTIGSGDEETVNRTGTVVSEFYTAKDYPTRLNNLGLEHRKPLLSKLFSLIGVIKYDMIGLSQGYSVETNDMHGKPKSVQVYNKSGEKISSVDYYYKSVNELAARKELKNDVKVVQPDGTISDGTIGMDVEMFSDMRQQITDNLGISIKVSGGSGAILIFPLPFFFPGIGVNYDRRNFRSSSSIKLINRFAIQYKTEKMENGSRITSENLLWDAETGNVLLTKTQNEFDDPIYSFAYPAHWKYDGMAQAYKNLGTILNGFSTGSNGTIANGTYNSLLVPGDELIDINNSNKYWIINSPISSVDANRVIDKDGMIQSLTGRSLKLLRSGRRNMANTAIATVVSLKNPIVGDKVDIKQLTKVLDAKATVFSEVWSVPVMNRPGAIQTCNIDITCMERFILASMKIRINHGFFPAYFYSTVNDPPYSAWTILSASYGVDEEDSICYDDFLNGFSSAETGFYQYNVGGSGLNLTIDDGDSAQLGACKMYFDVVTDRFNELASEYTVIDSLINGQWLPACGLRKPIKVVSLPQVACGFAVIEQGPLLGSFSSCSSTDTIMKFRLDCPPGTACIDPVDQVMNPYYEGVLGNWRPKSSHVYQVSRENLVADPAKFGSTDIRTSGAYSIFNPFWKYDYGYTDKWAQINQDLYHNSVYTDAKWIAANEMTYFNQKGLEVENKDALNRYSSALFGYLQSMPVAVASNTRYRELAYDGFEDYNFALECGETDTCNNTGHFNFKKLINGSTISLNQQYVHSGKFSLALNGTAEIVKTVYTGEPTDIFSFDIFGRYVLESNELAKGFSPIPGKKYVLSFWVKDTNSKAANTHVIAKINNGTNLISTSTKWPTVEGWKRIETQFLLSSGATSFELELSTGAPVYIDDIRIHPFDGQMKSFAYDPSSQRLWAEMDENNFATFYEYDDEGILIRVKKETERGIMTIKETRSSYRKR